MRNTGILLFLAGIYIVVNSGSFRDLIFGKARLNFINPKDDVSESTVKPHTTDFDIAHRNIG